MQTASSRDFYCSGNLVKKTPEIQTYCHFVIISTRQTSLFILKIQKDIRNPDPRGDQTNYRLFMI